MSGELGAVILAGGESRRMGTDKAALAVDGMTLLERTARLAQAADLPVFVVGRPKPDGWPLPTVTFLEDAAPGLGPLGGLATALHHAQAQLLALACDLPLLTPEAVRWLRQQYGRVSAPVPVPHGVIVVNQVSGSRSFPSIARTACR